MLYLRLAWPPDLPLVSRLVRSCPNINQRQHGKTEPAICVARRDEYPFELFEQLVNGGANVGTVDKAGNSVLTNLLQSFQMISVDSNLRAKIKLCLNCCL